jgi:TonB-dependent starch-binding outer membrane protein SusC
MKKTLQFIKLMSRLVFYGMIFQIICFSMLLANKGDAQIRHTASAVSMDLRQVNLNIKKGTYNLREVFELIENNTDFKFFYDKKTLRQSNVIHLEAGKTSLYQILLEVSRQSSLHFKQVNKNINVKSIENTQGSIESVKILEVEQTVTVTGRVTASDNPEGLPGVNVIVKGTSQGTVTDINGNYSVEVPGQQSILVFSSVGYLSEEVQVGNRSVINLDMAPDITALDEIVVVGYGTQQRRDITGSVASVKSQDLQDLPIASVDQALAGQVAGVQVQQTSGAPGGGVSIRVRGVGSISADTEPLYVIDGFPLDRGFSNNISPLSQLNPNDIESIEILKDAAAAAIYGSRGSNGVVLITTKKGSSGKAIFNFDFFTGLQAVANKIDMLNARQFVELTNEARNNAWVDIDPVNHTASDPMGIRRGGANIVPPQFLNPAEWGEGTDWQDAIFQNGRMNNYQLGASGGNENTKYRISGGYFSQEGIIIESGFERYSFMANVESQASDKLKIGMSFIPSYTKNKLIDTDGPFTDAIVTSALGMLPTEPIYNEDGSYRNTDIPGFNIPYIVNPIARAKEIDHSLERYNLLSNIFAEYSITNELQFKAILGVDYVGEQEQRYVSNEFAAIDRRTAQAAGFARSATGINWLAEYTLNYKKTFGKHGLDAFMGYSAQKDNFRLNITEGNGFPNDLVTTLSGATQITNGNAFITEWSLISYIGRVNYKYADKYLVTAALRRDGSSRFGAGNKWGYFPSISAGWRVTEESFFKNVGPISDLKFKASYGQTGNFNIGNYGHIGLINNDNYVFGAGLGNLVSGLAPATFSNRALTWEKSQQVNLGVDLGLFEDRFFLTAEYYNTVTSGLLLNIPIAKSTGFASSLLNIGEVANKGFEFAVQSKNLVGDFKWTTSLNFAANRNEVLTLGLNNDPIISGGGIDATHITKVGDPLGSFYGFQFDGIYQTEAEIMATPNWGDERPGDFRIVDVDQNGIINNDDRTVIGNPFPDFIYGLTNRLSYKNFELNLIIQGSQGNDVINLQNRFLANVTGAFNNRVEILERWRSPEEPGNGNVPRANRAPKGRNNSAPNSYWVEDASFMRIRNITLAYNFPSSMLNNIPLTHARIYASVQNAFTLTNYKGYNPEVNLNGNNPLTPGVDYGTYPVARVISIGVNLRF